MEFKCSSCGLCCRGIGPAIEEAKTRNGPNEIDQMFIDFPYKTLDDGSCEKLGEDGRCTVYEDRPMICSVDQMHDNIYSKWISRLEHYQTNSRMCNIMIKEANLPDSFLIDVDSYEEELK